MENTKATVSLFFDTRKAKKGDKYPIKITIYFDNAKKRYKTGIDLSKEEWNKINKGNVRDDQLKITRRKLQAFVKKAEDTIDHLDEFSFHRFEESFFQEKKARRSSSLQDLFHEYISNLEKEDRVGTAISYKTTLNSINGFKKNLRVTDITTEFLKEYERHLLSRNLSPSTIGIYLRQLRCIINLSISQGLLQQNKYPFKGFNIPTSRNTKKALNLDQIKSLLGYGTEDLDTRKALDFWLFSYISNGMNMTDICLLKPDNLHTEFFSFFRAKTKNTKKKDLRPIKVPLTDLTIRIIERWRNRDQSNPYLFPILQAGMTAKQIKYRIQDFIYFVNKHMKIVAKDLGIEVGVGTYVARHTHSTILKRMGVPTELIKENLGHSSVLITENYLDDFTDDVKLEYAKLLIEFEK